ncbi:MAG: FAD-dependent oxidoreductase [Coriobacteriales bacterium]
MSDNETQREFQSVGKPHYWQRDPEPITNIVGEETVDVVVLGAGIAGCIATQSVAESGASVICAEKFDHPTSHGTDVAAVNSIVSDREGVHIDPHEAARLVYQWSQQQANYNLIRIWAERSGEVVSHYVEMAEAAGYTVRLNFWLTARADWYDLDEKYRILRTPHLFDVPEGSPIKRERWNATYLVNVAYEDAVRRGARFMFNTPAVRLVRDEESGRVTGAIVKTDDGYKLLRARRGVILATGGITDNDEMKECFCPMSLRADKNENYPKGGNMGDGLVMGKWIGAAFSRCYPAPIIHPVNLSVLGPGMASSWLIVNRDGKRFMNEVAWEPMITNARLNAPGNVAWAIWDADYLKYFEKKEPAVFSGLPENTPELVEECVSKGEYVKADTLEGLAGKIGVPVGNLVATVERYNELADSGVDEDFGVPERFLSPCRRGPFYATRISAWLLSIPYGLHVDDNSQVCDEDDEPIPGLYAVGNVQGDFWANSYPVTCPGSSHGRSVTFGRLVGCALAKGENIDGTQAM